MKASRLDHQRWQGTGSLPDTWRYAQGLYFSWAELSSLPAPSFSRSLHRWKISFLFWRNSKAVQRKTCLGTESGGIGIIGKDGKAVVYSFFSLIFQDFFFFKVPFHCPPTLPPPRFSGNMCWYTMSLKIV